MESIADPVVHFMGMSNQVIWFCWVSPVAGILEPTRKVRKNFAFKWDGLSERRADSAQEFKVRLDQHRHSFRVKWWRRVWGPDLCWGSLDLVGLKRFRLAGSLGLIPPAENNDQHTNQNGKPPSSSS
jgi:hypothetical protein